MQPADRLRAQGDKFRAAIRQQPQADQCVVAMHPGDAIAEQRGGADRDGVVEVGLATVSLGVDPHPCRELGRYVEHDLAAADQTLRQGSASTVTALDGPPVI